MLTFPSASRAAPAPAWLPLRHKDAALERLDPGFPLLLDALAMIDYAVTRALGERVPACKAGCAVCCDQPIPLTPLEVMLLHTHNRLRRKSFAPDASALRHHDKDGACSSFLCPFLQDNHCGAYAVRPIACRQYLVFGVPCLPREEPMESRPQDVFTPDYTAMNAALLHTLPWYAAWTNFPRMADAAAGLRFLRGATTIIQAVNWSARHTPSTQSGGNAVD